MPSKEDIELEEAYYTQEGIVPRSKIISSEAFSKLPEELKRQLESRLYDPKMADKLKDALTNRWIETIPKKEGTSNMANSQRFQRQSTGARYNQDTGNKRSIGNKWSKLGDVGEVKGKKILSSEGKDTGKISRNQHGGGGKSGALTSYMHTRQGKEIIRSLNTDAINALKSILSKTEGNAGEPSHKKQTRRPEGDTAENYDNREYTNHANLSKKKKKYPALTDRQNQIMEDIKNEGDSGNQYYSKAWKVLLEKDSIDGKQGHKPKKFEWNTHFTEDKEKLTHMKPEDFQDLSAGHASGDAHKKFPRTLIPQKKNPKTGKYEDQKPVRDSFFDHVSEGDKRYPIDPKRSKDERDDHIKEHERGRSHHRGDELGTVEGYKRQLRSGGKPEVPSLGTRTDSQGKKHITDHEGRHRAQAALEEGEKTIPVAVNHNTGALALNREQRHSQKEIDEMGGEKGSPRHTRDRISSGISSMHYHNQPKSKKIEQGIEAIKALKVLLEKNSGVDKIITDLARKIKDPEKREDIIQRQAEQKVKETIKAWRLLFKGRLNNGWANMTQGEKISVLGNTKIHPEFHNDIMEEADLEKRFASLQGSILGSMSRMQKKRREENKAWEVLLKGRFDDANSRMINTLRSRGINARLSKKPCVHCGEGEKLVEMQDDKGNWSTSNINAMHHTTSTANTGVPNTHEGEICPDCDKKQISNEYGKKLGVKEFQEANKAWEVLFKGRRPKIIIPEGSTYKEQVEAKDKKGKKHKLISPKQKKPVDTGAKGDKTMEVIGRKGDAFIPTKGKILGHPRSERVYQEGKWSKAFRGDNSKQTGKKIRSGIRALKLSLKNRNP